MSNEENKPPRNHPNVVHDPNAITDTEREAIERKVGLVLSMAGDTGKNPDITLTVLSYALIHAAMGTHVTFASVIKVLADMWDSHPRNPETGDDDE
jgi:hypothetical protein